jgi:predicted GTPase
LSFEDEYELAQRQPDLFEQEQRDEVDLLNKLESLNTDFKKQGSTISSNSSTDYSTSQQSVGNDLPVGILNENFYAFDQTVKVMVLGNKGVGKSSFLSALHYSLAHIDLVDKAAPLIVNKENSKPTLTLEITKRLFKINNKLLNLEFWDTNEQMFNSPIIRSKD